MQKLRKEEEKLEEAKKGKRAREQKEELTQLELLEAVLALATGLHEEGDKVELKALGVECVSRNSLGELLMKWKKSVELLKGKKSLGGKGERGWQDGSSRKLTHTDQSAATCRRPLRCWRCGGGCWSRTVIRWKGCVGC